MRGQRGLLPDGLGRQRPAHRAPGPELLRRPLRSRRSPTTPTSRRPPKPAKHAGPSRSRAATSSSCATTLTAEDEKAFEALWRHLGLSVDWSLTYTTIDERSRRTHQRAFLRNLARGEAYHVRGADPLGRHVPDRGRPGRARGPRAARRLPPHRLPPHRRRRGRRHRDHPARAARRLRRPRRPPRRRALPAAVRHDGPHAGLRRRGPGPRPRAGRSREGHAASP